MIALPEREEREPPAGDHGLQSNRTFHSGPAVWWADADGDTADYGESGLGTGPGKPKNAPSDAALGDLG
jgi:hypothetical protein